MKGFQIKRYLGGGIDKEVADAIHDTLLLDRSTYKKYHDACVYYGLKSLNKGKYDRLEALSILVNGMIAQVKSLSFRKRFKRFEELDYGMIEESDICILSDMILRNIECLDLHLNVPTYKVNGCCYVPG